MGGIDLLVCWFCAAADKRFHEKRGPDAANRLMVGEIANDTAT
jgi:hypothetical protein